MSSSRRKAVVSHAFSRRSRKLTLPIPRPRAHLPPPRRSGDHEAYAELRARDDWSEKVRNLESLDYEVIDNRPFRRTGRHTARVAKWAVTLVIGAAVGALAFLVEHSVTVTTRARLAIAQRVLDANADDPLRGVLAASLVAAASAVLLAVPAALLALRVAPAAAGAGVALVMASLDGVHVPHLLSLSTVLVKVLGTILSVSSGLPVGPEGPLVHIGAGVASLFTRQQRVCVGDRVVFSTHGRKCLDAFRNDEDARDFLSAGVAAGLAAAFGAPIGGVLFSLEEASTHWSRDTTWRSLLCSTLAVFVLSLTRALAPANGALAGKTSPALLSVADPGLIRLGDDDAGARRDADFYAWELVAFALLAGAAGAVGAGLTRAAARLAPFRPVTNRGRIAETALVAGACAAIAVVASAAFGRCVPTTNVDAAAAPRMTCPDGQHNDVAAFLLGLRDDVISAILSVDGTHDDFAADDGNGDANDTAGSSTRPFATSSLFVALAATLATMPFACDLALPAGLFMPTILWGALLGSLFGAGARRVAAFLAAGDATASARVSPGAYAVVGATAALAGVFRSSISLVVIMVEGTGRVGYLVPLLVGVAVAVRVGDAIDGASFYEEQLRARGVPYLRHGDAGAPVRASEMAAGVIAADLVRGPPVCLAPKETVARVESALRDTAHNGFPVVIPDDDDVDDGGEADSGRRSGRLVGVVLRSQLMVLLARRAFVGRIGSSDDDAESVVDVESESALEAFYDDLDTDMRTFHHRKDFDDRTIACSGEAVVRLGLTDDERAMRLDIASFMKIAPLAVQAECSAWRALGYFRAAGLRHLPVVDVDNRVVGMLTRADLAPNEGMD